MNKFPVFKTILDSFLFIFKRPALAFKVVALYTILFVALTVSGPMFPELNDDTPLTFSLFIAITLYCAAAFFLFSLVQLFWYRAHLINTESAIVLRLIPFKRHEWRFVFANLTGLILFILALFSSFAYSLYFAISLISESEPGRLIIILSMLIAASASLVLLLIVTRLLVYVPAAAIDASLTLKDSFRLSKDSALRLAMVNINTMLLYFIFPKILFLPFALDEIKEDFRKGYREEMLEHARERQQETGEPIPAHLPHPETIHQESITEFIFAFTVEAILIAFYAMVAAGNIAQFYKWAIENRR